MEGKTTITVELTPVEREVLRNEISLYLLIMDLHTNPLTLEKANAFNKLYKAIEGNDHIKCDKASFNEAVEYHINKLMEDGELNDIVLGNLKKLLK